MLKNGKNLAQMTMEKIKSSKKEKWKFAMVSKAFEISVEPCYNYFGLKQGTGITQPQHLLVIQKTLLDMDKALEII